MSHAAENQDPVQCGGRLNLSSAAMLFFALFVSAALSACSGSSKSSDPPPNVGGGYTLKASGGTLNDGSGTKGLVVLATLRDKDGYGPGAAAGWTITITGPGFPAPLTVQYDDGSSSSYITWWWDGFNPLSGTYTASASNGTTTLSYSFYIDNTGSLLPPGNLIRSTDTVDTVSWNSVTGAGSYYYQVTDGNGTLVKNGYLPESTRAFSLPVLIEGSYLIEVFAHTKDRNDLMTDASPSPALPPHENISLATMDFVIGGGYSLNARGGVLYEGADAVGNHYYGFVVWASILTTTSTPAPPASDWNVAVNGPGNLAVTPVTFTYPRNSWHYIHWDFGAIPTAGDYTVTATSPGGTSISQTITIPNPVSQFPVATGLEVTPTSGGGGTATWSAVPGAASYYLNIWTFVGSVYTEVAGTWVTGDTTSAIIPQGTLTKGVEYDFYVTAAVLDMTTSKAMPPPAPGPQVDMSDTTFTYHTFIVQ